MKCAENDEHIDKHMDDSEMKAESSQPALSPVGRLFRFIGYWFGFSGLYAAFTVCPFCGQPGCPVGMASAGTIGAFFALCIQDWERFLAFIRNKQKSSKS